MIGAPLPLTTLVLNLNLGKKWNYGLADCEGDSNGADHLSKQRGHDMKNLPRIGAVVLTYNSAEELPGCIAGLMKQTGVDLRVIVVDNNSAHEAKVQMERDFIRTIPKGMILEAKSVRDKILSNESAVFIRNSQNDGYSAGNNVGARAAAEMDCEAILVINPDVRLSDSLYVSKLAQLITFDVKTAVACSAVRNLSGAQENPMSEPNFLEELLWPAKMIASAVFRLKGSENSIPSVPCIVKKVTGACFMIRSDFLERIGYFDDAVFLYCEEAILMAQIQAEGWHIRMDPSFEALHAHRTQTKSDPVWRYQAWAKSRAYFHRTYSGYGPISRGTLSLSRRATLALVGLRSFAERLKGKGA